MRHYSSPSTRKSFLVGLRLQTTHFAQRKKTLLRISPAIITDFIKYALYQVQDEICEFLIDKGADVDAVEPRLDEYYQDYVM